MDPLYLDFNHTPGFGPKVRVLKYVSIKKIFFKSPCKPRIFKELTTSPVYLLLLSI